MLSTFMPKMDSETTTSIPLMPILHTGCFFNFDSIACGRTIFLAFLSMITCIACFIKVWQLHNNSNQAYHHFTVFYISIVVTLSLSISFVLGGKVHVHLSMQFLVIMIVLVITHFFWVLASRAIRAEAAVRKFMHPSLMSVVAISVTVLTFALIKIEPGENECLAPYWLCFSITEFGVVQFLTMAGVFITRRLNEISTLNSVRWAQKRNIWTIITVLQISTIYTLIYDAIMLSGTEQDGCGATFGNNQTIFSISFGTLVILKLLGPIWVLLCCFVPTVVSPDQEVTYPAYSEDGTYGSAYSDDSQYRQLYHPTDMYHSVNSFPDLITPSPGTLTPTPTGTCDPRHGLPNPTLTRNCSATAVLEPISEEGGSLGSRKGSQGGLLAAARNIPKETTSSKAKCFNWLRSPSPGKIYL